MGKICYIMEYNDLFFIAISHKLLAIGKIRFANFLAERVGFEPTVPLLAEHTISSRAPSASSVISPRARLRRNTISN